jgi:site-specific recombinase XerD
MSPRTIESYVSTIVRTAKIIGKELDEVTEKDLASFMVSKNKRNLSSSSQTAIINSFASYYKFIQDRDFNFKILPRPRIEQKQPDVLNIEEMQIFITCAPNMKHRAIIALMYSCALRVSEVVNLKLSDIDTSQMKIKIVNGKGKVDRIVMLDNSILGILHEYHKTYRTRKYLFEGKTGNQYSARSIQAIYKTTLKHSSIEKRISSHSMRHSCLTQLIKDGVNLRTVQKIAGHKNINSTANYINILDSEILETKSPISKIKLL